MLVGIGCPNIKISERTHGGLKVIAMLQVNEAKSDDMEAFRQGCPRPASRTRDRCAHWHSVKIPGIPV